MNEQEGNFSDPQLVRHLAERTLRDLETPSCGVAGVLKACRKCGLTKLAERLEARLQVVLGYEEARVANEGPLHVLQERGLKCGTVVVYHPVDARPRQAIVVWLGGPRSQVKIRLQTPPYSELTVNPSEIQFPNN